MSEPGTLLIEIGTEELPPLSLTALSEAFATGIRDELARLGLAPEGVRRLAAPRRLAVLVDRVARRQPDATETLRGPPVRIALDDKGEPTQAGRAFADKCDVAFAALGRIADKKGEYLALTRDVPGQALTELLQTVVETALGALPVVRPMRWGTGEHEFVRPVHWLCAMLDDEAVPLTLFGKTASKCTYGHRFHAPDAIELASAGEYVERLATSGYVLVDPAERELRIRTALVHELEVRSASTEVDVALLAEVSALVEWPVAIVGEFSPDYLRLPREVLISTLKKHQRYFPVAAPDGALQAQFVTISNLESRDPNAIARGNERVVTPRLADAAFFYDTDVRTALADRVAALDSIVFETRLGSLGDKTRRVVALTGWLGQRLGTDSAAAERIALLSRADLSTDMVGEFPDLQGIMGRYYAAASGEPAAVAEAVGDFYRPAFAGDAIPATSLGQIVALADRADTLAGVFAVGKKPKGNKDPYGLRRAALGLARISTEGGLAFDLVALFEQAVRLQPVEPTTELVPTLYDFVIDRLRAQVLASRSDVSGEIFDAVVANRPASLVDFMARLDAVVGFAGYAEAEALAAANKRIANLLRKAALEPATVPDGALFEAEAEKALHAACEVAATEVGPLLERRDYADALKRLAGLQAPIDRFFDDVMVMTDDVAVRNNRLALLATIRRSFLAVADISVLSRAR